MNPVVPKIPTPIIFAITSVVALSRPSLRRRVGVEVVGFKDEFAETDEDT